MANTCVTGRFSSLFIILSSVLGVSSLVTAIAPAYCAVQPPRKGGSNLVTGLDDPVLIEKGEREARAFAEAMKTAHEKLALHDPEAAIEYYVRAQNASISAFWTYYPEYADVLAGAGHLDKALDIYRRIVYQNPEHEWQDAHGNSMRQYALDHPLSGAPSSTEPYVPAQYALLLSRSGQIDEALQVYQWALAGTIDSMDGTDLYGKGWHESLDIRMTHDSFDRRRFEAACYTLIGLTVQAAPWYNWETGIYYNETLGKDQGNVEIAAARLALSKRSSFAPAYLLLAQGTNYFVLFKKRNDLKPAVKQYYQTAKELARSTAVREMATVQLGLTGSD